MPPFRNYIIYISQVLLPMVFIINRTTLTDAIVLPVSVTSGSTRPISHNFNQLNGLIKDIFNTNNSSTSNSNTVENTSSSPVTTNALVSSGPNSILESFRCVCVCVYLHSHFNSIQLLVSRKTRVCWCFIPHLSEIVLLGQMCTHTNGMRYIYGHWRRQRRRRRGCGHRH